MFKYETCSYGGQLCHANLIFGLELAKAYLASCEQISAKNDAVCGHSTISVDAKPYHVIHMGSMSDVGM
jgi:hypothetical protein